MTMITTITKIMMTMMIMMIVMITMMIMMIIMIMMVSMVVAGVRWLLVLAAAPGLTAHRRRLSAAAGQRGPAELGLAACFRWLSAVIGGGR